MRFELTSKSFYMKTARLMLPVVLQQLISSGVNFVDNMMVGAFGETQIAAVAFSNQFYSLFNFICMGLGSGAIVLSSQFWGRKEIEPMRKVAAIALRLAVILCAFFTVLTVGFPQIIMRIYTNQAPVIAAGIPYLRLLGTSFLLGGLSSTATYLLRSAGKIHIPLIGSAGAFFLNVFFNWVFIFGKLGAPRLEVVGAAVGTIIARVFEFCFVFGYFILKDDRFGFRIKHFLLSGGELWRTYFKFGIPVLISDTLLGISITLTSVILGHVGETIAAASSIVNSVVQILTVVNSAAAGTSAIVIGNSIGEGDLPRAKREGNTYMLLSFLFGLVMIIPLLLLENPYFAAYNIAAETQALAHRMLICNCLWLPLQTLAYISTKGVLRGGGDTRFILAVDSGTVWLIALPLGALAGLVWHLDPVIVYIFLRIEYPLKGAICLIRYLSGKWLKVITAKGEKAR